MAQGAWFSAAASAKVRGRDKPAKWICNPLHRQGDPFLACVLSAADDIFLKLICPGWFARAQRRSGSTLVTLKSPTMPSRTVPVACTVGLRVFVCHNLAFQGDYTPVLAKHSKNFSLEDSLSIGVDRMQRNFEPMRRQVESWRAQQLSTAAAKLTIYRAFIEGDLEIPRHLARRVHELYFSPQHPEFESRTMWSLSNAFTSAFKELDPIPQFRATAKLGRFLETSRAE